MVSKNRNIGNKSGQQSGSTLGNENISQGRGQNQQNAGIGDAGASQGREPQDLQGQGGGKFGQGRSQQQQGQKAGRSQANPVNVESYLRGVDYPADKEKLISCARENDAPENVIRQLNQIADQDYDSPIDITKAMSGSKASNE